MSPISRQSSTRDGHQMHNRDRSAFHALVAQRIERSPAEAEAVGSSPAKRASDPATLREPLTRPRRPAPRSQPRRTCRRRLAQRASVLRTEGRRLEAGIAHHDAHGRDASECEIIEVQVMIRYC